MNNSTRRGRAAGAGRRPGAQVALVGEIGRDGQVTFPMCGLSELAKAFCLNLDTSTHQIYELGVKAIEDRPEFGHMKLSSRGIGDRNQTITLLNDPAEDTRRSVRAADLQPAAHRDPRIMSTKLIWARFMWRLREILDQNITRREQRQMAPESAQDTLPVPMLSFRRDDNTLWSLIFELTKFIAKQFTGPGKWAPGAGGAFAPRVRTAVEDYRRHNTIQANDAPVQDIPLRLMISLARKANERRPLSLDPTAIPPPPTTLGQLKARIQEIFNFPPRDYIDSVRLNCDDGREVTMTSDADFQRIHQQQGPEVMLSVVHVHMPPLDGGIDDIDHATYYPVGAHATIFGMPSNGVHAQRTQEQQERLINHVKHLGRNDMYTRPPTVDAATREAAAGDDSEGGRAAAVAQAEIQAHQDVEDAIILDNDRIEELQARSSPYNDMRHVLPILQGLLPHPATPNQLHPIAKGFNQARGEQARTIKYKAHQTGALTWMLEKEAQFGGGIVTDKAGTGKSILIAANIQASVIRHDNLGKPTLKPTLVAVPAGLVQKTVEDLHNMTRQSYRVFTYGVKEPQRWTLDGSTKHDVLFDPTGLAFVQDGDQLPRNNIVVVSLEQLSVLWDDHKDGDLEGLFDRIILDEGHHVRRCELTKRGALLTSMKAGLTWLFTATPVVNSLLDVLGYCAFLAKPANYSNVLDRNAAEYGNRYIQAMEFYATLPAGILPAIDQVRGQQGVPQNEGAFKPFPDEYFENGINSLADIPQERQRAMWRTKNFPACTFFRPARLRSPSIEPKERRLNTKIPDGVMSTSQAQTAAANKSNTVDAVTPPFNGDRIFDHAHPQDLDNAAKIITPQAFNYWILPHLTAYRYGAGEEHLETALGRIHDILSVISLGRSHADKIIDADGTERRVTPGLEPMFVERRDLKMAEYELDWYREYDLEIDAHAVMDMADVEETQREANPEYYVNDIFQDANAGSDRSTAPVAEPPRSGHVWRTLISAHPMLWAFRYRSNTDWFKHHLGTSLAYVVGEMRELNACNIRERFPRPPSTSEEVLDQFLYCSPVLRKMLEDAADVLMGPRETNKNHVLIYTLYPRTAMLVHKLLGFCGFKTCLLLSQMGVKDRWKKVQNEFNNSVEPTALIVPLSLRMEGYNLHQRCCNVFFVDQPFNLSVFEQSTDRVHRIGQTSEQRTIRYLVHDTFMQDREVKLLQKTAEILSGTLPKLREQGAGGMLEAKSLAMKAFGVDV